MTTKQSVELFQDIKRVLEKAKFREIYSSQYGVDTMHVFDSGKTKVYVVVSEVEIEFEAVGLGVTGKSLDDLNCMLAVVG